MKENKILKYTLFLLFLGLIAGVLLGSINALTAPIIDQREKEELLAALYEEFDYPDFSLSQKENYENLDSAIEDIFFAFDEDGKLAAVIYQTAVPGYEKTGFVRTFVEILVDGSFGVAKMISHDDTPSFADSIYDHDFEMKDQKVDNFSPVTTGVTQTFTLAAITKGFNEAAKHFRSIQSTLGGITND